MVGVPGQEQQTASSASGNSPGHLHGNGGAVARGGVDQQFAADHLDALAHIDESEMAF
jgi:hypothetical protein